MIDLQALRDAYAVHDISNVGFIRVPNNPADGLTKIGKCRALYQMLLTGKCDFNVEQWVIRCSNAATSTNYLTNIPLGYDPSCRTNNIHSLQDITFLYERSCEHPTL